MVNLFKLFYFNNNNMLVTGKNKLIDNKDK